MQPVTSPHLAAEPDSRFVEIAKDQPEYQTLPAVVFRDGKVLTEWALTEVERAALVRGENIRLWIWACGQPLQPIALEVTSEDRA